MRGRMIAFGLGMAAGVAAVAAGAYVSILLNFDDERGRGR
jgi:hypothetical protein